jgi:hypothetical protein
MNWKQKMIGIVTISALLVMTGCYGSFGLTKKVYDWNGQVGDKTVNSLVMFGLLVIPVYEVSLLADWAVFNVIEYWTGSNPMAMEQGEKEEQIVSYNGELYRMIVSKNAARIEKITGENQSYNLIFVQGQNAWFLQDGDALHKVAAVSKNTDS